MLSSTKLSPSRVARIGSRPPGTQQSEAHSMILAICMAGPIAHPSSAGTAAKTAGAASPAGDHDVGVGLQRAAERLRAHLADKMERLIYVSLTQRHHAVDRGHATGTH